MSRMILILALAVGCTANREPMPGNVTAPPETWEMGAAGMGGAVTSEGQDQPAGAGSGAPSPAQPAPAGAAAPPPPTTPSDAGTPSADQGDTGVAGSGSVPPPPEPDPEPEMDCGVFSLGCRDSGTPDDPDPDPPPPADCDLESWDCRRDQCDGSSMVDDTDARPWDASHPRWAEFRIDSGDRCLMVTCQGGEPDQVVSRPDGYVNEGDGVCFTCMAGVPYFEPCP